MADITELKARYEFRKTALTELRTAYLALTKGGVKSYMIEDRQVTRFDIATLLRQIKALEEELDALDAAIAGLRPRKAFGVFIRDW